MADRWRLGAQAREQGRASARDTVLAEALEETVDRETGPRRLRISLLVSSNGALPSANPFRCYAA